MRLLVSGGSFLSGGVCRVVIVLCRVVVGLFEVGMLIGGVLI